jgi:hypothetical protein
MKGNEMDTIKNQKEWIEASLHQAFVDRVVTIREEMLQDLDREILTIVGFDNSLRNEDEQTYLENQLNEVIAEELFRALSHDQLITLLNSHNTDR